MKREALVLYLQNVRDLEVAKHRLEEMQPEIEQRYISDRNSIATELPPIEAPSKEKYEYQVAWYEGILWTCGILGIITGILLILFGRISGGANTFYYFWWFANTEYKMHWGTICIIISVFMILLVIIIEKTKGKKLKTANEQYYQQAMQDYSVAIANRNSILSEQNRQLDYATTDYERNKEYVNAEMNKVSSLLKDFYDMNIIPSQYRNLPAMLYIYDYMSTSQASFEDTLIHEHMENGIQRLEQRLSQVIDKLDVLVYETRCLRAENAAAILYTINQNMMMLDHLASIESNTAAIEQNTADAAEYAKLASNYSKANAYFELANYLKSENK